VRGFDERWRALARSASRSADRGPTARESAEAAVRALRARPRGAAPDGRGLPWMVPAAAVLVLYALALPALSQAWAAARSLAASPLVLPRPPAVAPPPLPAPPRLPTPPTVPGSTELLNSVLKEMQP